MTLQTPSKLRFEAPGPGAWEQDPVHMPRPMTRYYQETHPPAFKTGTNDFARFYGMLIDGLDMAYVNGFGYRRVVPAPDAEMPQRFARAEEVMTQKLWREQIARLGRDAEAARRSPSIGSCRRSIRMRSPMPILSPISSAAATIIRR